MGRGRTVTQIRTYSSARCMQTLQGRANCIEGQCTVPRFVHVRTADIIGHWALGRLTPRSVDLVCFSEMIFTGAYRRVVRDSDSIDNT